MSSTPVKLTAFASVFTVAEVAPSLRFFTERLGCIVDFQMGEPPTYAIVERGAVSLHLMPKSQDPRGLAPRRSMSSPPASTRCMSS